MSVHASALNGDFYGDILPLAETFEATGRAYVRFALAHPSLFRLMMKTQPSEAAAPDGDNM